MLDTALAGALAALFYLNTSNKVQYQHQKLVNSVEAPKEELIQVAIDPGSTDTSTLSLIIMAMKTIPKKIIDHLPNR